MKVKINDVAREANVSVATVSRVVNNVPLVNEDTKKRVQEAIKKTGYRPNAVARSLKIQKTNTLGIMIPDIANPLYTDIVRGAEDASSIYKYNIILSDTDLINDREQESLNTLMEKQCDGIIYIGKDISEEMKDLLNDVPCDVVLGGIEDTDGNLSAVIVDNEGAARELVSELIDKGHKNIAVLSDSENGQVSSARLNGVLKAIEDKGIKIDDELIKSGRIDVNGGYNLTKELLDEGKDIDLIVTMNDQMALGALKALEEAGKKVPDEVAVTGFNDNWQSKWLSPTLTTVSMPMYDLGAIAARMLIKRIENEGEQDYKRIVMPYEIVYRDSTN